MVWVVTPHSMNRVSKDYLKEKNKIIPAKDPNREGLVFLVRTYVEFMVTF